MSLSTKTLKTRTRYMLVGSDFSAQEPRLTAFMSADPAMIQAYLEGKDLYAVIAQAMYGNEYWENLEFYPEGHEIEFEGKKVICGKKTHLHKAGKERRSTAKTLLLALLYGMSDKTMGSRMGKTEAEGHELKENFFRQFPKVRDLMDASREMLTTKGYVEDWAGRRRHLPDYSLPPYEVLPLTKEDNFNPFLECEDRSTALSQTVLDYWNSKIALLIKDSNDHQSQKNPNHVRNQEMSNAAYEVLARGARKGLFQRQVKGELRTIEDMSKSSLDYRVQILANTGRIAQAERQCLNARIQGGAASLTKLAMVNVDRDQELKDLQAKLVITVHDEVLVECPVAYADQVEKRLPQVMIDTAAPYINVPMACDPYVVRQWYIDEYSNGIQEEFKKAEAKGVERDLAIEQIVQNHPEMSAAAINYTITTGEPIDIDQFPVPKLDTSTIDCYFEVEELEENEATATSLESEVFELFDITE